MRFYVPFLQVYLSVSSPELVASFCIFLDFCCCKSLGFPSPFHQDALSPSYLFLSFNSILFLRSFFFPVLCGFCLSSDLTLYYQVISFYSFMCLVWSNSQWCLSLMEIGFIPFKKKATKDFSQLAWFSVSSITCNLFQLSSLPPVAAYFLLCLFGFLRFIN